MHILKFLGQHDIGMSISGLTSVCLAVFGSDAVSAVIAFLLMANLFVGIVAGLISIRRKK